MEDAKKEFAQRLREAMDRAGYQPRPSVLEREYNLRCWGKPMTLHGVRRWLKGETLPSQEKLLVIAEWLQVSPQELLYGPKVGQPIKERRARWEEAIGHQEREIFEAYLKLPQEQRKVIREVIVAFCRAYPTDGETSGNPQG